jgi:hypothetical protein
MTKIKKKVKIIMAKLTVFKLEMVKIIMTILTMVKLEMVKLTVNK